MTIGRQTCFIEQDEIESILSSYDPSFTPEKAVFLKIKLDESKRTGTRKPYSEPLLGYLGAEAVDSLDYSDYEDATIIQDMNILIPQDLKSRFSFVLDAGTLEHIFNFPVAIKNCMDMVRTGGHLMIITPANNFFGHGFYQFSSELFFSLLSEENGYTKTRVFTQDDRLRWYEVSPPKWLKRRVDICRAKNTPALINVISRKIAPPSELIVQQSDYVGIWEQGGESWGPGSLTPAAFSLRGLYRKIPKSIRMRTTPFLRRLLGADARVLQTRMQEFYTPRGDFDHLRKTTRD